MKVRKEGSKDVGMEGWKDRRKGERKRERRVNMERRKERRKIEFKIGRIEGWKDER